MCIDRVFLSLSAWLLVGRVDRWPKGKKGYLIPQGSTLMLLLYMIVPILLHFIYIICKQSHSLTCFMSRLPTSPSTECKLFEVKILVFFIFLSLKMPCS